MKGNQQVFGIHAVRQVLNHSPETILHVWLQETIRTEAVGAIADMLKELGLSIQFVSRATLDKRTHNQNHQGVLLEVREINKKGDLDLDALLAQKHEHNPLYLVLDSVQDPHNLGACIRTAATVGITAVIIPKNRAASINETVRKVASGAVEQVLVIQVVNLSRALKKMKQSGIWVVGTDSEAVQSVYDLDLKMPTAIVMGGEHQGIRDLVKKECDYIAALPQTGTIESLNVSVATGVVLYEAVRQRLG